MYHAEYDGKFHLVRVQEYNFVLSQHPNWIYTQRIRIDLVGIRGIQHDCLVPLHMPGINFGADLPLGAKYVDRLGEQIVVNGSGVDGEQTHEKYDVPATEEDVPDLVVRLLGQELLLPAHHISTE